MLDTYLFLYFRGMDFRVAFIYVDIDIMIYETDKYCNKVILVSIKYGNTKFGVDSSSHFPFRVRTHIHKVTDATDHPPYHGLACVISMVFTGHCRLDGFVPCDNVHNSI